jgi:hypothetical protein
MKRARNNKQSKTRGYPQARIKESGKVPIGKLRSRIPGVAPCTSLLPEKAKGMRVKNDGKVTRFTYDYQTAVIASHAEQLQEMVAFSG